MGAVSGAPKTGTPVVSVGEHLFDAEFNTAFTGPPVEDFASGRDNHREPESARVPEPSAPPARRRSRTRRLSSGCTTSCTSSTGQPAEIGFLRVRPTLRAGDPQIGARKRNGVRAHTAGGVGDPGDIRVRRLR